MRQPCSGDSIRGAVLLLLFAVGNQVCETSLAGQPGGEPPLSGARPAVIQLHWYPQAQFAGYMVAQDKGFFRKVGLKVRLSWTAAGERAFEQLVEGRCDFCTGWLSDAMRDRDAGKPLVNIAQVFQQSSAMLVAWSRSGIKVPQDMTGKRVGLWGGNNDVQALAFFQKYHVQPTIVPKSASMVPFLRGAVNVASAMHYNEYNKLIEAGVAPDDLRVFSFAEYGLAFPEDGLYCTAATRQSRAGLCAKVVAACREGWDYALDHEVETLDTVMKYCREANVRTNRNHQRWMLRSIALAIRGRPGTAPAPFGSLAPDVYQSVARKLLDQQFLRATPDFDQFYQPPAR
jgi:NitT/TauT family transport system substrate-binding protein